MVIILCYMQYVYDKEIATPASKGQKRESSMSNEFFKEYASLWTHIIFFIFPYIPQM